MGHKDVSTTLAHANVLNRGGRVRAARWMASGSSPSSSFDRRPAASRHRCAGLDRAQFRTEPTGFRTVGCITLCRVPRPTPLFLTGFTSPEAPFHGSEAGKRRSEARFRASEPGSRGPETRFRASEAGMNGPGAGMKSPLARMNGPLAGICTSGVRVRRHVGGERTRGRRASGPENRRDTRRRPARPCGIGGRSRVVVRNPG